MGFFDLFTSREKREKMSHLKNLIVMAMADGKFQKAEAAAIAAIMRRDGLTPADFIKCMKNPQSIQFTPPESYEQRRTYLKDMVYLMMCDGHIAETEIAVCKMTAIMLGYKPEVVEAIVETTIATIAKEIDFDVN